MGKAVADCPPLRCSFCDRPPNTRRKLISAPSHYPRAYICDACVQTCMMIVEDDRQPESEDCQRHQLLDHPLASDLMAALVEWITAESAGQPSSVQQARVRDIASQVIGGE